ncbi:HTH-type transcriptional regulator GntR [Roseovarius gaetbuli]|uniref:HTH-type transcriptional regulator GntR n=2 Tax=Roseovarius gaetbuli TaxID=1356575 RepID=A0A1X6Y3E1_9RHOB|nr:HTH-type transcriptional regulator GntR [Roseovarius gaetbuli]
MSILPSGKLALNDSAVNRVGSMLKSDDHKPKICDSPVIFTHDAPTMDENNIPKNTASNRRPTLSQVAAAAGVSEITASRAMRGGGLVAKATADRVQAAARELNYVPNRLAGTLAGGASRQVGVILPSLSNSVFADVLKGLEDRLEEAGYQPVLGISNYDPTREERLIENLLSWRPAGIVIAPADMTAASRALLLRAGLPVVEIMDVDATPTDMAVGISHLSAGRAMAHYLVGRGYERFAYLGHSIDSDLRALARLEGFRGALGEVGRELAQCLTLAGPSSVNLGREGLARLLAEAEQPPDLVYFSNDDMAVGGMFHCMAAGISVPGDLALAGFNGLEIGQALPVPLTTTASNRAAIGTEAARQLLQRFKGGMPEKISDVGFRLIPGQTA